VANGVESLGEIEGYDNDIRVGLEQAGDGVEKGNDGSRYAFCRFELNCMFRGLSYLMILLL